MEDAPGFYAYWGKAKPTSGEGPRFHRLPYHALDVAACAHVLLRHDVLLRRGLAQAAGLPEEEATGLVVYLASLHDAGKYAPAFQLLVPELALELRPDLAHVDPRLKGYHERHDTMGYRIFDALWDRLCGASLVNVSCGGDALVDSMDVSLLLAPWAAALTGHHGKPPRDGDTNHYDARARDDVIAFALATARLLPPRPLVFAGDAGDSERRLKRSSWLAAGLGVLADWLGSNQRWFPYRDEIISLDAYWCEACDRAEVAVSEAGVRPGRPRPFVSFSEAFPEIPSPSPLQRHVVEMPLGDGPQLIIIEESTGAGKTEAALGVSRRLMDAGLADGIYLALPTMATANGMLTRVEKLVPRMFEPGSHPSLILAHSATEVRRLLLEEQLRDGAYIKGGGDEEETASLQCARWLSDSRKKAMLAHVGVGTIDQALLGVLPAKHAPLRLLGLHHKVLVVDEVHAYDDYVSRLLERLLEFHASLGGSAVLLSATLPARMRRRLQDAFARGLGATTSREPAAPSMEYPLVSHLSREGRREEKAPSRSGTERDVDVRFVETREQALSVLGQYLESGRSAAWVRNTIGDAIEAYDDAAARFGGERVTLFHGRFALGDRIRIEDEVLGAFGKESGPAQRAGRIVIATQVIEQSLDLDFDGMVTDLAPIDLLVQRAGRLCRHPREVDGSRAARDARGRPLLHVLAPPWTEAPAASWLADSEVPRTRFVYPHLGRLWLTQRVLRQQGALRTPDDARVLVEAVYGEDADDGIPPGLRRASEEAEGASSGQASLAHMNAVALEIGYARTVQQWLDDTRTPTRLGEETTRLRLARLEDGDIRPLHDAVSPWLAWHLSEVSVAARHVTARVEGPHEEAIAAAMSRMPDEGKWCVTVLLERDGADAWVTTALGPKGEVRLRYSRHGLEIGGDQ